MAARDTLSFQDMILALHAYWSEHGCLILQPYDMRMGAGTFHTATTLRALGPEPWNAAFVQPSRRPTDGQPLFSSPTDDPGPRRNRGCGRSAGWLPLRRSAIFPSRSWTSSSTQPTSG